MEIVGNIPNTQLPVFLVNETVGEIVTKVTLERFSPEFYPGLDKGPYVDLQLEGHSCFPTSIDRKHVMTFSFPCMDVGYPEEELYFPDEVSIELKVTLCQPAEKIQNLPPISAAANLTNDR